MLRVSSTLRNARCGDDKELTSTVSSVTACWRRSCGSTIWVWWGSSICAARCTVPVAPLSSSTSVTSISAACCCAAVCRWRRSTVAVRGLRWWSVVARRRSSMHTLLSQSPHVWVARASWWPSSISTSLIVMGMRDTRSAALRWPMRMSWSATSWSIAIGPASCPVFIGFGQNGHTWSISVEDLRLVRVSLSREKVSHGQRLVVLDVGTFLHSRNRRVVGRVGNASRISED